MAERTVTVESSHGLHARPAALFAQAAAQATSAVTVTKGDKQVNAASILSVISLGVSKGDSVTIASDDEAALDELEQLLSTDHDA
ncbi:HPr family phosphocarrier protein [Agrococcus sp. ARC_14]|uniref:HPr family phosphocarrier protein n=1 Tax=Agrococcus sp. ARC_14 TaxID=2919927 RepID=UPI001F05A811|nr:HPr family phosphocarrier protein [Agrococcus sp. ARC_14]MCH1884200.1 HPr family phosphocarrier protein [Agrococcus sp. ARC_14]